MTILTMILGLGALILLLECTVGVVLGILALMDKVFRGID